MKIVFDMDDTLWGLNERVCLVTGINIEDITDYDLHKCYLLSEKQRNTLFNWYSDAKIFKHITWFKGVDEINELISRGIDVHFNSNYITQEIYYLKLNALLSEFNITQDHIKLGFGLGTKDIDASIDIFVDDSPYNILVSNARLNIMLKKPWNTSSSVKEMLKDKNIIWFDNFQQVIDYIKTYSLNNRNLAQ